MAGFQVDRALIFAGDATRNVVDLDEAGAARFLARDDQPLGEGW